MADAGTLLARAAEADAPYVVSLRRYFHENPELSKEEFHTAEKIEAELTALGIAHKRVAGTGVYAELKGEAPGGRTILLRADIDALPITETHDCSYKSRHPGVMHACGHDAHAAALLGAARVLARNRNLFGGTVRLVFQPGEEVGYGGRIFVDEGYVDGADRTFGLHMASDVPAGSVAVTAGPNNASVDWFRITVSGKSAHVSTPELGVDAAYIAAQILVSLQALVTRRTNPMENVLIGVGRLSAGTAYNIVADRAELEGTIRVFTPEIRKQVKARLEALAAASAGAFGGSVSFQWHDNTSPLINDEASALEVQRVAGRLFGPAQVIKDRRPSLGGDDFAEFNLRVPGVYAYVGTRNPDIPETCSAHHTPTFDIDERALLVGTKLYAAYAAAFLNGEAD